MDWELGGMESETKGLKGLLRGQAVLVVCAILAVASMALVPPSADYVGYIDVSTLCILFCFMATVAGIGECNAFKALASGILHGRSGLLPVCVLLVMLPFFCSMFITNDVSLITFVPFTFQVLSMAKATRYVIPVVVLQTVAANLGCMALPFGSPHNLYMYTYYGMSATDMVLFLAPLLIVGFALLCAMALMFPRKSVEISLEGDSGINSQARLAVMLALFAACVLTVLHVIPYWATVVLTVAVVGAVRPRALAKVDYSLLLTFICLFVFTGNVSQIDAVGDAMTSMMEFDPMLASVAMSQVISNVPAAVLLSGFTDQWQGLLAGVNIGGFGTPIASMASLISLRLYMRTAHSDMGRYMAWFTAANVLVLAVLMATYYVVM